MAGVYFSETTINYFWLGFGCNPYYRSVRYSWVFGNRELTVVWTTRVQKWNKWFGSHTSNIVSDRLDVRVWWTTSQSSLLNIYFRLSGLQPSLLLIHFRDGPNRCSHCTEVWHKTYPICDTPLSRSAWRRSFAPSQKSHRHGRSCMWTEALSGMIFLAAQTLSGTVWTYPKTCSDGE